MAQDPKACIEGMKQFIKANQGKLDDDQLSCPVTHHNSTVSVAEGTLLGRLAAKNCGTTIIDDQCLESAKELIKRNKNNFSDEAGDKSGLHHCNTPVALGEGTLLGNLAADSYNQCVAKKQPKRTR